MSKQLKKILIIVIIVDLLIGLAFGIKKFIEKEKIKNAIIKITYKDDLSTEFLSKVKISDFIEDINGTIINDYQIDTTNIETKKINYEYINEEGIKLKQSFNLNIVDKTPPLIWLNSTYSIAVGSKDNLIQNILCGDNLDSNPNCYIEGEYDLNTVGKYSVVFKAIDKYGNESSKDFTLNVYKPSNSSSSSKSPTYKKYSDIVSEYKNKNTKIGLDLSEWQDYPDYDKLKASGVEFVILRVGGTKGREGEYFLDKSFTYNIENANRVGIPVGLYFFSYATSVDKAKENAKWLLNQIENKNYKIDLPISFDWENWSKFNQYHISFYELKNMADIFIKTVEEKGYKGMNYGSKTYLENMWMESDNTIWLAHYTSKTNYNGKYKFWQICDNAIIDGINGPVDVNIMYVN